MSIGPQIVLQAWSLEHARSRTDELFRLLPDSLLYERPVPERHRLIFYLGHVEAFDWNQIARFRLRIPSFHPTLDHLFEAGIDPLPGQLPSDQPADWPRLDEVRSYCATVRARLDHLLPQVPPDALQVAIEHRLMHAETLAYLLHNLCATTKLGVADLTRPVPVPPANDWVEVPAGSATLGALPGEEFRWDNELPQHQVFVPGFRIQRFKVTNGEWLEFVKQGGPVPHFWQAERNGYLLRGMFGLTPLPLDHPVYVTQDQAAAYAAWLGATLPTEPQFHRAAYGRPDGGESRYPWGSAPPSRTRGNFDFYTWETMPVHAHPCGESAWGVAQLVGNGWEWTRDLFRPFPGFQPLAHYPGYSAGFFDEDHYVLKGGSPRTAASLLRRSFRNWFRPDYPYVYSGFRCVESI